MRRLLVIALVLGILAPAAAAATLRSAGDGTLSVRDARGTFTISGRGGVIGSFTRGRVIITDPVEGDGTGPIVSMSSDDVRHERNDTTTVWIGTKIRFRMIGGTFKVRVVGRGVNLSIVGRGTVVLNGEGTADDGSYSVNGEDYAPVPDLLTFPLAAPSAP